MGPWLLIGLGNIPEAGFQSFLAPWIGGVSDPGGTPPPPSSEGFQSLLGFWIGGISGSAGTTPAVVGWPGRQRRRHKIEDLERSLQQQRANTFGRHWFSEFQEAQQAALDKAKKAKSKAQREALIDAVAAVQDIEVIEDDIAELTRLFSAAAGAGRVTASLKHTRKILDFALIREAEDEEEAIELLLLH
jgi:hypothetical protein